MATALVDQRHVEADVLAEVREEAQRLSRSIAAEEEVEVAWSPLFRIAPIPFDEHLIEIGGRDRRRPAGSDMRLPSGPLHDAARVAEAGVPTVMLFVRSKRGLSHTREEDTDEADLALAVEALDRLVRGSLEEAAGR